MGEGEFKRRIRNLLAGLITEADFKYIDMLFDGAAKKFPAKLKTWHVGTVEFYSSKEIDKWLVEWFGDRGTDEGGTEESARVT